MKKELTQITFEQVTLTWRTEKKYWPLLRRLVLYSGMVVAILKLFCMYSMTEQLLQVRVLAMRKGRYKYGIGEVRISVLHRMELEASVF